MEKDQVLQGNEKIEEAIRGLQNEPTQEMLAHALTVVRRRMKENGHCGSGSGRSNGEPAGPDHTDSRWKTVVCSVYRV